MLYSKQSNLLICIFLLLSACKNVDKGKNLMVDESENKYYQEPYRPQFHFSPKKMWMNDPNGMVYHKGVYHLFYQYYPEDIVWGPMHWGHATSKDLVQWEHKPIALYPDENGLIFSGSAVVDFANTSGFGTLDNPALVAIFTYHLMEGEKAGRTDFQTQGIAYSLDNGDTWTKFEENPVIGNNGIKDFRDPKVFWDDINHAWVMSLVAGDHLQLWSSNDLKKWTKLSEFGKKQGAHGGVWECPDLFKLKVEGADEEKWVLLISINPGAPNGGSGTQYFIGDFDGAKFTTKQTREKWIDWGTDNYAGVTYNVLPKDFYGDTYSNDPEQDRIFIGWMSNWAYARETPTKKWRSAMTVPRKLTLKKIGTEYELINYPVSNLNNIIHSEYKETIQIPADSIQSVPFKNYNQSQVKFRTTTKGFELVFKNDVDDELLLTMNSEKETFVLDRRTSGKIDFHEDFASGVQTMPMNNLGQAEFEVRILMDASSIEVFINEGQYVMTAQVFPNKAFNMLDIENNASGTIILNDFEISKVASIWQDVGNTPN
ncbi:glycoside hydrolase family 32 protein [Costertonia aggregata]|uniref:Glycoside hydrolase family 32 protein n=1 Tax=Costertonia aggregata TaxID=343403 RepID=A0A7H9AQS6_9FLAO|nr:glycoside hydrolase family 32 protein [Costertonia aggregata]QLG45786.1 glycoside hydrolase family 32 protein [Costertonia aggregata]